jgi:hypothetical protein
MYGSVATTATTPEITASVFFMAIPAVGVRDRAV